MREVLSVGVDPIGQLRNTRKQFTDPLSFVEELFQNAQRAKASSVWWNVNKEGIQVRDNGIGCTEFAALFTQSISGWDQETVEDEGAFGIGFFSSILAADLIEVRSKDKRAVFDVEAMFRDNRLDVVTVSPLSEKMHVDGFEIRMRKLRPEVESKVDAIKAKIEKVARFLPVKAFFRGHRLAQTQPLEITDNEKSVKFIRQVHGEGFKGLIWMSTSSWRSPVAYYQNRPVKELYGSVNGVDGRIFVENGAANLRCPDRKEFIYDDKYSALTRRVKEEARSLARTVLETGTRRDVEKYESTLDDLFDAKELADLIRFDAVTPSGQDLDRFAEALAKLVETYSSAEQIPVDRLEDLWEKSKQTPTPVVTEPAQVIHLDGVERIPQMEKVVTEVGINIEMKPVPVGSYGEKLTEEAFTFDPNKPAQHQVKVEVVRKEKVVKIEEPKAIDQGTSWDKLSEETVFWCELGEAHQHLPLLRELVEAKARIVIARNRLQRKVLSEQPTAIHVRKAVKSWKKFVEVYDDGPRTPEEAVARDALSAIERLFLKDKHTGNLFRIGRVDVWSELVISDVEFPNTRKKVEVIAIAHREGIWLNRDKVSFEGLVPGDRSWLRWVMLNLETISHELAHILDHTDDDTLEHYQSQLRIQGRIIQSLFGEGD